MTRAEVAHRMVQQIVTVSLKLFDAEPRRFQYSAVPGRMYQPLRVQFIYERIDGSPWDVKVTLMGQSLNKDGQLGRLDTDEKFYSRRDLPDWLDKLVGEHMPAVTG